MSFGMAEHAAGMSAAVRTPVSNCIASIVDLPAHRKLAVPYVGCSATKDRKQIPRSEVDDALAIAEQVDVLNYLGRADPLCPSVYGRVVPILLQKSKIAR